MTKLCLFTALADVATTLQAECARLDFSPHKLALDAIVERLDVIIDTVLEEGVQDDGWPPRRPGEGRWLLPRKPEEDDDAPAPGV